MSLLIAVKSCFRDMEAGAHDAIRATWAPAFKALGIHTKFFIGKEISNLDRSVAATQHNSYVPKSDEVILDCRDDYESLVHKTRGICKYVISKNIEHVLLVDTDCCVYPKKVANSNYKVADYSGIFNGGWGNVGPREVRGKDGPQIIERCYSWARGAGYFLSKRASFEIADTPPVAAVYAYGGNEDLWVGQVLGPLCAQGEYFSMQLDEPVCKYYLTPDGHSTGYEPKSNWMQKTWEAGK